MSRIKNHPYLIKNDDELHDENLNLSFHDAKEHFETEDQQQTKAFLRFKRVPFLGHQILNPSLIRLLLIYSKRRDS